MRCDSCRSTENNASCCYHNKLANVNDTPLETGSNSDLNIHLLPSLSTSCSSSVSPRPVQICSATHANRRNERDITPLETLKACCIYGFRRRAKDANVYSSVCTVPEATQYRNITQQYCINYRD